ncbi:hypothetical protein FB106_1214 [Synechococcus sp. Ace-Pa]|nr:hypothetical protein [Synechococcus sp. CS-603]TWB87591.1 hypothetical protein FB106_1214 [Synechococcus sp. Ace-Pa]
MGEALLRFPGNDGGGVLGPIKPASLPGLEKQAVLAGPALKQKAATVDAAAPHAFKRRAETEAITLELDAANQAIATTIAREVQWTALCEEGAHPGKGCKCCRRQLEKQEAKPGRPNSRKEVTHCFIGCYTSCSYHHQHHG